MSVKTFCSTHAQILWYSSLNLCFLRNQPWNQVIQSILRQGVEMDQTSESEKQYQGQIYEDIKQRLINAGYFRARIRLC